MKSIGEVIKEARVRKRFSRAKLEKKTKIKKGFIEALEIGQWEDLPELPVIQGFVRNIASVLAIGEKRILALLRRDYPPKSLRVSPKPDLSKKFSWSPKLTFLAGVVLVTLTILGYLGVQYVGFISPPKLRIEMPQENEVVTERLLIVSGATDPEAVVRISNQLVLVGGDGSFKTEIEIFEETKEIIVVATSRSGKETVIRRRIRPEFKESTRD